MTIDNPSNLDVEIVHIKDCYFARFNTIYITVGKGLQGEKSISERQLSDRQALAIIQDILEQCLRDFTHFSYSLEYIDYAE
jgi:hypothetical protein